MLQLEAEDAEELMRFMDIDCSGSVDYEEFVAGVLEDGDLLTSSKLHTAFDFLDKNRNGMIDLGERLSGSAVHPVQ